MDGLGKAIVAVVAVLSGLTWAQAPRPVVAQHPLALKRTPRLTAAEKSGLTAEYARLLIAHGARSVDTAELDQAMAGLGRDDCERENACLALLAQRAHALYALHVSLDQDVTRTRVTATGRLVRDDGALVGTGGRDTVAATVELGKRPFPEAAKAALAQVFEQLQPGLLPTTRPVAVPVAAPVAVVAPKVDSPPAASVVAEPAVTSVSPPKTSLGRTLGFVGLGAGAALLVGGGIALGLAAADSGQIKLDAQGNLPEAQKDLYTGAKGKEFAGQVLLISGAAVAVAGGLMTLLSPATTTQAMVVPMRDGAVFAIGGSFP